MKKIVILVVFTLLLYGFSNQKTAKIFVFHSPACHPCKTLQQSFFPKIESKYQNSLTIKYVNINNLEERVIYEKVFKSFKEEKRYRLPAVLIADKLLLGIPNIEKNLQILIEQQLSKKDFSWPCNIAPVAESVKKAPAVKQLPAATIITYSTIIGAGLIDGVNPCVFSTLLFLIAFLSLVGKKNHIGTIGISFVIASFATYMLLGVGVFTFLKQMAVFRNLFFSTYILVTIGVLIACFIQLSDYYQSKKGEYNKIILQLPKSIKRILHLFVRKYTSLPLIGIGAFCLGIIVTLVESVCTGQVYLPIIMLMIQNNYGGMKPYLLLALYNMFFILPTIIIFLLAWVGVQEKHLQRFFTFKTPAAKLFLAGLFFILFLLLLLTR